jgi:hypothetical protein
MSNYKSDAPMVSGLFHDRESAENAYRALMARGYSKDDVTVVMADETRQRLFSDDEPGATTELGTKAAEGAGIGAGVGGALGALLAGVAAVGTSLVVPGLGLVVAGPLAAALAGAGAGGVSGGLLGALIGSGMPEETVQHYEQGLKGGGILLGVKPRSEEDAMLIEQSWRAGAGASMAATPSAMRPDVR